MNRNYIEYNIQAFFVCMYISFSCYVVYKNDCEHYLLFNDITL